MNNLIDLKHLIPENIYSLINSKYKTLTPVQLKAIKQGLFTRKNMLVCSPTASGKTLVAELAFLDEIINHKRKAVYVVPLRALANEKYDEFKEKYGEMFNIAISTGDFDSDDAYLKNYDLIVTTSEKLDSLIRHKPQWIYDVGLLIVDEIHLLNDVSRGATLEFVIISLQVLNPNVRIIGLSATIGNSLIIANWLNAELVYDTWRPIKLYQGVMYDDEIEFFE